MEETRTEGLALPQRGDDRPDPAARAPSWKERLDRIIEDLTPKMVEVRRHLHAHPEPSGNELATTRYLQEQLTCAGSLQIVDGPEGRGLVASQSHPPSQPEIAFRADIDALWIRDAKDVPYRSRVDGVDPTRWILSTSQTRVTCSWSEVKRIPTLRTSIRDGSAAIGVISM